MLPETTLSEIDAGAEYRLISIELIRDPQAPARETMDEQKFLDLCQSIADVGLIEPLVVKDCNEYFEVIAGHRRTMACRAAGLQKVPCMIRRDSTVSDLAIMIHENAVREDMNPVEEGRFYQRALNEECGGDVDRLCSMLKRGRDYVEGRILLLAGYPNVLKALEEGHISIGVSRLLNKINDPNRLLITLDMSMQSGANARQVAEWVRDANGLEPILLPPEDPEAIARMTAEIAAANVKQCVFCLSEEHQEIMVPLHAHNICLANVQRAQSQVTSDNPV